MSSQPPADLWLCVTRQSSSWCADTTGEQTSSCQLSQKTHRHAQTHYRPFKYTYSPNIHRNTFIKQLPHRIWACSAVHQRAHSGLLIVTNNEEHIAQTADTDTWALECKWKKHPSGFDAKRHKRAVLPADLWQKTTVMCTQRREGKMRPLNEKQKIQFFILIFSLDENSMWFINLAQTSVIFVKHRCF